MKKYVWMIDENLFTSTNQDFVFLPAEDFKSVSNNSKMFLPVSLASYRYLSTTVEFKLQKHIFTSQTPKRVENRNIKPIVGHLPAESQQDLFKVINKHVRTTSKGSDWCEPIVHLILVVWLMRREISTWRVSISQLKVQSHRLKTCWKMIAYVLEVYLERYASKQFTDLQSFTRKMCFFLKKYPLFSIFYRPFHLKT